MMYRWLILAATAVSAAGLATAQPPQSNARDTNKAQPQNAHVVLASAPREADATPQPTEAQPAAQAPAKPKRAARVTSCRCGDSGQ